ncbi:MAG: UDP-N-acetylmuramoyl-L-alanyl-D-glutamate--2,6-diaminopimelate ligase [Clostridia bacterium]|nr:UDP-N-acetylmuramoyl-L-alanyl-D-glutamate--2,6-diaminopimelate ligase [Clostridia bacterium]
MKLSELLKYIEAKEIIGKTDMEISGLCTDSKSVEDGDLFFCYEGKNHDSHGDIAEITDCGAVAVVCERKIENCKITQIITENGRAQIALAARAFYGFADKKLKIVGITGTNGKTTTTYMLASIFKSCGKPAGVIGTLGISYGDKFIAPELTTPDPVYLHSVFADMVKSGVEYVFMEVSAHALYFDKIEGLTFEVGVLTNCTQDHLDFFGNMQDYSNCKKLLFKEGRCKHAVINSDDSLGVELLSEIKGSISYGIYNPADVFAVNFRERLNGTDFVLNLFDELYEIKLCLPAQHNVYNAMAAAACARLLGVKLNVIAKGLSELKSVPGRLEHVAKYNGADVFVDFAHTPDGLEKSLKSLKKLCTGRLFCLFGCGGNRDKTKRPVMGEVAAKYADFLIITSDNPRYEDPYDIISEIEAGVKPSGIRYVTVTERDVATEYALELLAAGDILLVAGKGGEHYQEIMGIKHSYNDNTVIKNIIGD